MTCKDCIHEAICDEYCETLSLCQPTSCGMFKDKSRFVELPCKVGDTVYYVSGDRRVKTPKEYEINGFFISEDERYNSMYISRFVEGKFVDSQERAFNNMGKYIFLTREEAEKALKESEKE